MSALREVKFQCLAEECSSALVRIRSEGGRRPARVVSIPGQADMRDGATASAATVKKESVYEMIRFPRRLRDRLTCMGVAAFSYAVGVIAIEGRGVSWYLYVQQNILDFWYLALQLFRAELR